MTTTRANLEEAVRRVAGMVIASDETGTVTVGDLLKTHILYERERCAKMAEEFDDFIWSERDGNARMEDGTTHILTRESMKRLATEIRDEKNP